MTLDPFLATMLCIRFFEDDSSKTQAIISDIILDEQFGFLQQHQIHDVVSLSQEMIHSTKQVRHTTYPIRNIEH